MAKKTRPKHHIMIPAKDGEFFFTVKTKDFSFAGSVEGDKPEEAMKKVVDFTAYVGFTPSMTLEIRQVKDLPAGEKNIFALRAKGAPIIPGSIWVAALEALEKEKSKKKPKQKKTKEKKE